MVKRKASSRSWFRSAFKNRRRAPTTLAQAQPPAPQTRSSFVRPTFRPPPPVAQLQQTQPQAPAPPPTPPVAAAPPATASPPPQPPSPVAAPPSPATTSVPSSPIINVSSSPSSLTASPSPEAKPSPKSPKPKASFPLPAQLSDATATATATASTTTVTSCANTPTTSPKIISPLAKTKTPPLSRKMSVSTQIPPSPSPKMRVSSTLPSPPPRMLVSTLPSPLVLPPAQIKFDDGKPETKIPVLSDATASTTTVTSCADTPTTSPKIISPLAKTKTPPLSCKMSVSTQIPPSPSPKMRVSSTLPSPPPRMLVSTLPSPLVLPPAQIKFDNGKPETKIPAEAEQKTTLMQETIEEPKMIPNTSTANFQKHVNVVHNGKPDVKKDIETKDHKGFYKKYLNSEDFGKTIIIVAGENRGAIMELSPSHKKHDIVGNPPHGIHKKGNPTALISDNGKSERDSNQEGRSKTKDKTHKMVSPLKSTFINSNVQDVNISILCNFSFTPHDHGVHLSLSRKANGGRGAHLEE